MILGPHWLSNRRSPSVGLVCESLRSPIVVAHDAVLGREEVLVLLDPTIDDPAGDSADLLATLLRESLNDPGVVVAERGLRVYRIALSFARVPRGSHGPQCAASGVPLPCLLMSKRLFSCFHMPVKLKALHPGPLSGAGPTPSGTAREPRPPFEPPLTSRNFAAFGAAAQVCVDACHFAGKRAFHRLPPPAGGGVRAPEESGDVHRERGKRGSVSALRSLHRLLPRLPVRPSRFASKLPSRRTRFGR